MSDDKLFWPPTGEEQPDLKSRGPSDLGGSTPPSPTNPNEQSEPPLAEDGSGLDEFEYDEDFDDVSRSVSTELSTGVVPDPGRSLEAIAITTNAETTGIPWERRGFRRAIAHVAKHLRGERLDNFDKLDDVVGRIRPDGFYVDCKGGCLYALEVEDTHPLSRSKLGRYMDLWFELDASARWDFVLIVTDRYGRGAQLDLPRMWMASLPAVGGS